MNVKSNLVLLALLGPIMGGYACREVRTPDPGTGGGTGTTGAVTGSTESSSTGGNFTGGFDAGNFYDGPAYDGDMSCAPPKTGQGVSSCCEGVPCEGTCELHGGLWSCACFGLAGGCGPQGLRCCGQKLGCVSPNDPCSTLP